MISLDKARKLLGKTGKNMTDQQVEKITNELTVLANILLDQWEKMTPEERNKLKTKNK